MKLRSLLVFALLCLPLAAQNTGYDIALIGDMPYGASREPLFQRLIADINKSGVDFTIHIGDTKSGSTRCDDSHYAQVLTWFNSFSNALIYSIGDNEWTDCMRSNNGGYDPLGRLAIVRKTLFPTDMSLGQRPIALQQQSDDSGYSTYVENRMLVKGPVVFATIHMPGSNNNYEYKTVQGAANPFYDNDVEYKARNAANIAWLHKTFATARAQKLLGVMIAIQANIFESFMDTGTGSTHSGFADFVTALREETNNYSGEVVLVSGDSHYMRVDKPLTDQYPACDATASTAAQCVPYDAALDSRGNTVLNFTRLEVPGSANVHWAIAHIRPNSRNLFSFEFMIVPPAPSASVGVTASITAAGTQVGTGAVETGNNSIVLDASKSMSSNSGDLTYSWESEAGYPVPGISKADTATPLIQFPRRGTYRLKVTVTDRTGATGTATIIVRYA